MMGISRSSFYHKPARQERQLADDFDLKENIENIHLEFPGYGYRRVREHLLREGKRINSKRIKRVMQKHSLLSCVQKLVRSRGALAGINSFNSS